MKRVVFGALAVACMSLPAFAASPAWVKGNSCGNTATATTITCNIRSDGLGVVSGDSVIVTGSWQDFTLNTTAASSTTTLTFASVPATVVAGNKVVDYTTPSAIAQGVTVQSTTATTVVLTSAASGVLNGDAIGFDSGTVTDNQSNVYTLVDSKSGSNPSSAFTTKTYAAFNVTNGPTSVTWTLPVTEPYRISVSDEYSNLSGTIDKHAINEQTSGSGTITSGSVTTATAGDLIYGVTVNAGSATPTPGTGFSSPFRETSKVSGNDFAFSEDFLQASAGVTAGTFSSTTSDDFITTVAAFAPATAAVIPTAISCTPISVLVDNTASGTTVCPFTVSESDGLTYSGGANTISPSGTFAISSATGNGNVTLNRNLVPVTDDHTFQFTISATKNGVTANQTFTMTVTPATQPGNPYSIGWKNIDPGASASDGSVVFTAPHTMTVNEISMRIVTPVTGPALVDVYKAPPGTPCQKGTKLHTSDLDASIAPADHVQTVPLITANTSLAIYDSVCLVTQPQPFPTNGQATITVTAQ